LIESAKAAEKGKRGDNADSNHKRTVRQRFKDGYASFSDAAYYYSQYLDIFVGVAPEYVILAWGAIRSSS
jgi:hypothetical protein